ncbi:MAG: hypothetical protein ACI9LE_002093 [Paraglaciecola sp.]
MVSHIVSNGYTLEWILEINTPACFSYLIKDSVFVGDICLCQIMASQEQIPP